MKSVTEFMNFTLTNGLKAKTALAAEGKTPEEIQTSLGETFKMEGDKLKHFFNAIDVAGQNPDKLKRVLVVNLAEGETAPAKAIQVEEAHYVPEFLNEVKFVAPVKAEAGGRGRQPQRAGGKGNSTAPKGSPWGMTPEEKALKAKGAAAAKAAASEKKK
ncbi:MAG: hypothetical protein H7328_05910 [Bdellovibrio sp.]|nr:hypothetical protein [Bdellovibrio sp.]